MATPVAVSLAEMLANLNELLGAVREAAQGYKASLIADGWNEELAGQLALNYLSYWQTYVMVKASAATS